MVTPGPTPLQDRASHMHTKLETLRWYALQTAPRKEKLISSVLSEKGYECFLPLYSRRTVWSDRIKVTSLPLFPGYVFSRFDVQARLPILMTPGVNSVVGNGKIPAAVSENDLNAVRAVLRNKLPVEPCDSLEEGDLVRVIRGPLEGLTGSFVQYRGSYRLILSISLINRSVAVDIDRAYVESISSRRPFHSAAHESQSCTVTPAATSI
jgi:transcription antitermination factor NusG